MNPIVLYWNLMSILRTCRYDKLIYFISLCIYIYTARSLILLNIHWYVYGHDIKQVIINIISEVNNNKILMNLIYNN